MADRKITDLAAQTSLTGTDLMMLVRSGANYKVTVANMITSILSDHLADATDAHDASSISVLDTGGNFTGTDVEAVLAEIFAAGATTGWVSDSANTWTRTGNQTFTVSGDRTAVFSKGTRLQWTQTTVKYGVVVASSHAAGTTTVTIATNTDYVLTAAAISANSYSYAANPQGYPAYFNYTPTWKSTGTQPALGNGTLVGFFTMVGARVSVRIEFTVGSTSTFGTGFYTWSLPITAVFSTAGTAWVNDNGTAEFNARAYAATVDLGIQVQNGAATAYPQPTVPFTWATGDQVQAGLEYVA